MNSILLVLYLVKSVKLLVVFIGSEDYVVNSCQSVRQPTVQTGPHWEGKMRRDLFLVRLAGLAGAGSGDSRTSGHLDQPPLETD